jgi:hypothetical protein
MQFQIAFTNTNPIDATATYKYLAPVISKAASGVAGAVKLNFAHGYLLS